MIVFDVVDRGGTVQKIEVPEEINLSLMEVLKASEYNILATCGGMALCATCQVEVTQGIENLPPPSDSEIDMLDQLPNCTPQSRLACQIKINENLKGAVFHLQTA
jgi:2Fe-2S ferredoxin